MKADEVERTCSVSMVIINKLQQQQQQRAVKVRPRRDSGPCHQPQQLRVIVMHGIHIDRLRSQGEARCVIYLFMCLLYFNLFYSILFHFILFYFKHGFQPAHSQCLPPCPALPCLLIILSTVYHMCTYMVDRIG